MDDTETIKAEETMTVPEDAKYPEPPWKEIVTKAWRIVTDWETDYKKDADARCLKKMHALLVGKWEEPWRQWDHSLWPR